MNDPSLLELLVVMAGMYQVGMMLWVFSLKRRIDELESDYMERIRARMVGIDDEQRR